MGITALIFDFDGLLMDTEGTMVASWQHEWRHHGLELDLGTFFVDHGGDVSEERYAALAGAVGPEFDRGASHARRVAHRDSLNADLKVPQGIQDWIASASDLKLAVASSSPTTWVLPFLARTGYLFDVVACGDEVAHPKPDPGVYILALERLGVDPAEAIAFEDSPHGVAAAKAAGLKCVAIPTRYSDLARYTAADLVLTNSADKTLAEILDLAAA
ncbi:HAD-IA family hydrolase [Actinocrispum sp. NPDC049592]|uniref:HAD family hydrolase n=1 Tax=Actinocrispum sp. NPDC049592 TaxID=3154835 RepID=UPI00343FB4C3